MEWDSDLNVTHFFVISTLIWLHRNTWYNYFNLIEHTCPLLFNSFLAI